MRFYADIYLIVLLLWIDLDLSYKSDNPVFTVTRLCARKVCQKMALQLRL